MNKKFVAALMLFSVVMLPACSKRQMSVEETGSFPITGTTMVGFCRGTSLFMWIPTSGGSDEIEAIHYNDPDCQGEATVQGPAADPDGVVDDEE